MRPVGKTSFQFPCIHGNCQKWRFNPFLYDFEQLSYPSTLSKARGCLFPLQFSSQHDFLNNLSLVANLPAATSVSRLVDSARDCLKGTASDFSSDEAFQYSSTRWSRYAAFWVCCSLIEPSSGREVFCP